MLCDSDEDYSSDEDEDYVPSGEASEVDSGEDDREEQEDAGDALIKGHRKVKAKNKSTGKHQETKSHRKGGIRLEDDNEEPAEVQKEDREDNINAHLFKEEDELQTKVKKDEVQKKKADDLWSSFLSDVGQRPKAKPSSSSSGSLGSMASPSGKLKVTSEKKKEEAEVEKDETRSSTSKKTVTVTKVFDFAGEEVTVTEEVASDSKEAQRPVKPKTNINVASKTANLKRSAGGLSSVLGMIDKKPKMSVLDKSNLDWRNFKTTEGIADDLEIHNKGKYGYVEKQKFLARADQRQYEKERDLRMGMSKR